MKRIKILHTEWSDGWGGQEIRIIGEMLGVREKGVEVFLACKDNAIIKQKAIENNIPVFTLTFRGNIDFKTLFSLKKIIKKHHIDIVNTHSGKDTWVGGLAAKLSGAKFIRTRHLSNKINPSRTNFINELADYVFTTGEGVRADMIAYNRIKPEKITSIPTGIDETIFNPQNYNTQECKEAFGITDDEIVIGNVAVLRNSKRLDNFITIVDRLNKAFPEKKFKFLIAGEGPKRKALEQQIKDLQLKNITLLGHIDNVAEFLSALDIFLFTSDSREGVPQSVMQALCMERNVVATDDGSTADLYHHNNFLLTPTDIDTIYHNVKQMVEHLDDEGFINKNRKYIIDNFSKNVLTDKILSIYEKIS